MRPADYLSGGKMSKASKIGGKKSNTVAPSVTAVCACNGLACCTLDPTQRVPDCRCVVHTMSSVVLVPAATAAVH